MAKLYFLMEGGKSKNHRAQEDRQRIQETNARMKKRIKMTMPQKMKKMSPNVVINRTKKQNQLAKTFLRL